jgi:hypothetical protein
MATRRGPPAPATEHDLSHGAEGLSYDAFGDREIDLLVGVMNRVIAEEPEGFTGIADVREFAQVEILDRLGMSGSSRPRGEHRRDDVLHLRGPRPPRAPAAASRRVGEQLLDERFVYRVTHPAFEDSNTGYGHLTAYASDLDPWSASASEADALVPEEGGPDEGGPEGTDGEVDDAPDAEDRPADAPAAHRPTAPASDTLPVTGGDVPVAVALLLAGAALTPRRGWRRARP